MRILGQWKIRFTPKTNVQSLKLLPFLDINALSSGT